MRTLYLTLAFSVLAHTLALLSMSSVPEITLPTNETMVITLTSGSAGSSSPKTQNTDAENKSNKTEPQTKPTPQKTKQVSTTPKVLQTEEKQAARVMPAEKTTTAKTQESQKNTPSEIQTEPSNLGKNNKQGESGNDSGIGTGSGSYGNQGSGKGSGGGGGKITAPVPTHDPAPPYPSAAERLQQQGTVQVALKVSASGSVSDVTILRSSQSSLLDNATKRTLKSWRFKPAQQDGNAITSSVTINILFTPEGVKVLR